MDQTPEEIEQEITETREALGEKVDALAGQFKDGVETAKTKGLKVLAIGIAAIGALIALKRKFKSK